MAGLETGTLGGLMMLAVQAARSALVNGSPWLAANLLASTFYGERVFAPGLRVATFSGVALHLILSGTLGILFGLVVRDYSNRFHVFLSGLLSGLAWYYLAYGLLWKSVNPLVPLYSPERPMLAGHLLLGGFLGAFPHYLAKLRRGFAAGEAPLARLEEQASE